MKSSRFFRAFRKLCLYVQEFGVLRAIVLVPRLRVFGSRDPQRIYVPTLSRNVWLRPRTSDVYVFEGLILHKDSSVPAAVREHVNKGGLIVDAGANVGISTLIFHSWWPGRPIVAVECDQSNFDLLRRNTDGIAEITPVQAALWRNEGVVRIMDPDVDHWSLQVGEVSPREGESVRQAEVAAVTLEGLLRDSNEQRIAFLKMDIEGAEKEVLESLNATNVPIASALIELHERKVKGCIAALEAVVEKYDFSRTSSGEYELLTLM